MILTRQAELREAKHEPGLQFRCGDCSEVKDVQTQGGAGYCYYDDGPDAKPICYACCAVRDRAQMIETGRATLYLTTSKQKLHGITPKEGVNKVTNWPGSLSFDCAVSVGSHNFARHRYDVWFTGPDGREWHGVTIGDNTQICHCRRKRTK